MISIVTYLVLSTGKSPHYLFAIILMSAQKWYILNHSSKEMKSSPLHILHRLVIMKRLDKSILRESFAHKTTHESSRSLGEEIYSSDSSRMAAFLFLLTDSPAGLLGRVTEESESSP